nr:hypothetical protein B0A51_16707 [Rachicladosporium sp. CCFEE 5018]
MSVTTTENPLYHTTASLLRDYDIHHSNTSPSTSEPASTDLNPHPNPSSTNPESWPTDHRRIPEYRPINRELDSQARGGWGRNPPERTFVFLMMNGVGFSANAAKWWRRNFKRWLPEWFHYKIGGEW